MTHFSIVSMLIFLVAVSMTMVGKGGGNFYVVILALTNIPMHEAATTGQFILFSAAVAAMIVFQKNSCVAWELAVYMGVATSLSAFGGGYFSHLASGFCLKIVFALMLLLAGVAMLLPGTGRQRGAENIHFGRIRIKSGTEVYAVNLWMAVPVTLLTGFGSGMAGVSGGSFLVPLMVLACGVPMHTAVGTASTLIAATAFMGFAGHALQGDFNPVWALPLAFVTVMGGMLGGAFALKSKPKHLKKLFAYTNWIAALFMFGNALHVQGIF